MCVLRAYFCEHTELGDWRCIGYRWQPDDSKVSRLKLGGLLMLILFLSVREINWDYVGDSVPAFLTLVMIPLTYK